VIIPGRATSAAPLVYNEQFTDRHFVLGQPENGGPDRNMVVNKLVATFRREAD
jgi:hypothetical protein